SPKAIGHAIGIDTSQTLWTILTKTFSQECEAREFKFHSKLQFHLKIDTMTIGEYLSGLKTIFDQLQFIGKTILDQRKVFLLLTYLGPTYESFAIAMLKPLVPTYSEIMPLL
ncbi:UBN2 domain-containing protein, partial [Cephalotus follicularis]